MWPLFVGPTIQTIYYMSNYFFRTSFAPHSHFVFIYTHEGPSEGSNSAISRIDFKARTAPLMSLGYLYPFISFTLFVHLMFYF